MIFRHYKYILAIVASACMLLVGCVDDPLIDCSDQESPFPEDEPVLNILVTLDYMGGRSVDGLVNPMEDIENYIDPEKFRVLFFDHNDKFLFESKSRWVKKVTSASDYNAWMVSVPFFSYGNDKDYNWNWPEITEALKNNEFKIAILANRPPTEYLPELEYNLDGSGDKWFGNEGPYWKRENSIASYSDINEVKDIFDLHHSQWDPVYKAKSIPSGYDSKKEGFYDFIMTETNTDFPQLSSTVSWVNFEGDSQASQPNRDPYGWGWRRLISPSYEKPIPMYGVQRFRALTDWQPGTTMSLERPQGDTPEEYRDKPISLLRSCVRIEILIPRTAGTVNFMTLWYSNIYGRCEPMDVWSPTDSIWTDDHDNCEWKRIQNYGRISRSSDDASLTNNALSNYQKRLSWFYGSWLEKGWGFGSLGRGNVTAETNQTKYPRVFNPVIQRNNTVFCGDEVAHHNTEYYRYIVYTGERNVNDPSNISTMGNRGAGQGTAIFWMFNISNKLYCVPITDYNISGNPALKLQTSSYSWPADPKTTKPTKPANTGKNAITPGTNEIYGSNNYMYEIQETTNTDLLPLPLLRNHIYRLTLTPKAKSDDDDNSDNLVIRSEEFSSPTLLFR